MRIVTNAPAVNEMKNSVIKDYFTPQGLLVENTKAKPLHENNVHVEDAKSRFAATVSSTLSNLMVQKGYSRARATSLLLNSIRDKDEAPTDSKVISFMNKHGIGYDEASQVLIVSEAIRSSCSRSNISPAQAVDDLTSKLRTLSSENVGIAPTSTFKKPSSVGTGTIANKDDILPSSNSSSTLISVGNNKIRPEVSRHPKRRKSVRKNSSNTINISSNHGQKNKKSSVNTACPYQSYSQKHKLQGNDVVNVCERTGVGKKSKKSNVNKSTIENHNVTSLSIKVKSSTNVCTKRKRERERTQQHVNTSEAVLAEGTPSKKLRRSSTA